jgi:t-SNARE complex subunit (syntaxin)
MEDRYIELKDLAIHNHVISETPKKVSVAGVIMGDFLDRINSFRQYFDQLKENNESLIQLKPQLTKITTPDQEKKIQAILAENTKSSDVLINKIKDGLDSMSKELKKLQKDEPDEPETRAMTIQYQALTTEFQTVISVTRVIRDDFKNSFKSKVERQVRMIDENLTDEEIDQITEDPRALQKLIASKTIGKAHLKLQYAVSDIIDKYQEIQNLEKSVQYILKLLNDISIMVHEQGEFLNDIEKDLQKTTKYLEKGVKTLEGKKVQAIKSRKRMCCMVIFSLVLLGLIATPIALKMKGVM